MVAIPSAPRPSSPPAPASGTSIPPTLPHRRGIQEKKIDICCRITTPIYVSFFVVHIFCSQMLANVSPDSQGGTAVSRPPFSSQQPFCSRHKGPAHDEKYPLARRWGTRLTGHAGFQCLQDYIGVFLDTVLDVVCVL